jgi:hypothetical protein
MAKYGRARALLVLAVLVWTMSGPVGWAAEEGSGMHFSWNFQEKVKPEMMDAYMQARIADAKLSAEQKFPFPFLTFVNDFSVATCGVFKKFAQMDDFPQMMAAWNEKTNGKAEQLNQQMNKCIDSCSTSITAFRPDLSYVPENPAFTADFSKPFYQLAVLYHIKPDKSREAEAMGKKLKALNEKNNSPMGYWVYECICGPDVPTFVVILQAKDKAAFVNLDQKMQANPDEEIEKVLRENVDVLAGIETMDGTYVPEASYVPEGTF